MRQSGRLQDTEAPNLAVLGTRPAGSAGRCGKGDEGLVAASLR